MYVLCFGSMARCKNMQIMRVRLCSGELQVYARSPLLVLYVCRWQLLGAGLPVSPYGG